MFSTLAPRVLPLRVPLSRQLELASANGFKALGLPVNRLLALSATTPAEQIKALFSEHGLPCGGWEVPFDLLIGRREFSVGLRRAVSCSKACFQARQPVVLLLDRAFSDEFSFTAYEAEYTRRLPHRRNSGGTRLPDRREPIGPKTLRVGHRYEFVLSIPMALELIASADRPNIGLLVDCFHWYTSCGDVTELTRLTTSQVVYVHITKRRVA
jgi:sugar phosphate isomerase/epimerase